MVALRFMRTILYVFEDFIAELRHCGRCPEPKSVIIQDNASFHHAEKIAPM